MKKMMLLMLLGMMLLVLTGCASMDDKKETYQKIADETGASSATISRVNRSLTYGADGYRRVLEAMGEEK